MLLLLELTLLFGVELVDAVRGGGVESERAETADVRTEGTDCSTGSCGWAREVWCGSEAFSGELWNAMGSMSRSNIALDDECLFAVSHHGYHHRRQLHSMAEGHKD